MIPVKRWDYTVKHNVQIPDEYDEICHDPELFYIPADELEKGFNITTVAKTPLNRCDHLWRSCEHFSEDQRHPGSN